ncbi:MAG TPA: hypothetical protein VJ247_07870 [Gaiella sp.]|jgi:hypothetical protein|nr:hypothetical protein [Gaiella sp.]
MPRFKDQNLDPGSSFPTRQLVVPIATAVSLTKRVTWARKFLKPVKLRAASVFATAVTAAVTVLVWIVSEDTPMVQITPAIDAVPEKWKTTGVARHIHGGAVIEKAAVTAQVFSANYTINNAGVGQKWGVVLIQQALADGAYSTKTIAADQAYATQGEALTAAAGVAADAGKIIVGAIAIQSKNNLKWTANTDDLTAASDVGAVAFYATGAVPAAGTYTAECVSVAPAALAEVVEDAITKHVVRDDQYLAIGITTDATGAATNLVATLDVTPWPMRGDSLVEV